MSSQFGVNARATASAARPVTIKSSTVIGIVGYDESSILEPGLYMYSSVGEAVDVLEQSVGGTLLDALEDIDSVNVACPIILSVVNKGADDATTLISIQEGVALLKQSLSLFDSEPDLIVVPEYSHEAAVAAQMQSVAASLLGVGIVDLDASNEAEALLAAANFGTRRLVLCHPYVKTAKGTRPMSTFVAAMIAATDAAHEYGWANSFSNRVVNSVIGSSRTIEFIPGQDCEADRLRAAGITTLIRYSGFRFWGGETTDIDAIWQDLTRVRIADRMVEAGIDGVFFAIDRRADELIYAKNSIEGLLNALKGAGVLLGFDIYWDEELNTKENITAGKFYLVADWQNTPIVKHLEVNFNYVDKYGDVLINIIS